MNIVIMLLAGPVMGLIGILVALCITHQGKDTYIE